MMIVNNPYKDVMEWGKVLTNKGFRFKGTFPGSKGNVPRPWTLEYQFNFTIKPIFRAHARGPGDIPGGWMPKFLLYNLHIYNLRFSCFQICHFSLYCPSSIVPSNIYIKILWHMKQYARNCQWIFCGNIVMTDLSISCISLFEDNDHLSVNAIMQQGNLCQYHWWI